LSSDLPDLGLRYRGALASSDLSGLPGPLRTLVRACQDHYLSQDRGAVRAANDKTIDSRAHFFAHWLQKHGIDIQLLSRLSPQQIKALIPPEDMVQVIGTFMHCVNLGNSINGDFNMVEKTLRGYMSSAAQYWFLLTGMEVPLYMQVQSKKEPQLNRYLNDVLEQHLAWKVPKPKREPYTSDMFEALAKYVNHQCSQNSQAFLMVAYAVLDWARTGVHTGSRLAEYGQSKKNKGDLFARVPNTKNAAEWVGMPIAFIREDYTFYDANLVRRPYHQCLRDPSLAAYVHIWFQYDKSLNNFITRKFQCQLGSLQVDAFYSSPGRFAWSTGKVPTWSLSSGICITTVHGYTFITGEDVSSVMQFACKLAYPNPNHYMRLHIHLIQSHSNCITAAVALFHAGIKIPVIAYHLRWHEESVSFYLRDCFKAIGSLTAKAVQGAYLN